MGRSDVENWRQGAEGSVRDIDGGTREKREAERGNESVEDAGDITEGVLNQNINSHFTLKVVDTLRRGIVDKMEEDNLCVENEINVAEKILGVGSGRKLWSLKVDKRAMKDGKRKNSRVKWKTNVVTTQVLLPLRCFVLKSLGEKERLRPR